MLLPLKSCLPMPKTSRFQAHSNGTRTQSPPPGKLFAQPPAHGPGRVLVTGVQVLGPEAVHLAQGAFFDELMGRQNSRDEAEVEGYPNLYSGKLGLL